MLDLVLSRATLHLAMAPRSPAPRRRREPHPSAAAIEHLLSSMVVDVMIHEHLAEKLAAGTPLRVKLGADPTSPDLHLGHAVILWKLREFQELGHTVVLIIGDATAQIGDPTGKSKVRPLLSKEEVAKNARTYLDQVGKVLDMKRVEVRKNSEWFSHMRFPDILTLGSNFTIARLIEREDFHARLVARRDVYVHELLYPVMQAYDSIMVEADVELGGTDQLFNMLAGRDLQRKMGKPEQDILTLPLLVGTDGKEKMSKSLGNVIGLADTAGDMFGKTLSVPDTSLLEYARLAARWDEERVTRIPARLAKGENPRDIKAEIASAIVALYHGARAARTAEEQWTRQFRDGALPTEIPERVVRIGNWKTADLLAQLFGFSKSEARRLLAQHAVHVNGERLAPTAEDITIRAGDVFQVGKRTFARIAAGL